MTDTATNPEEIAPTGSSSSGCIKGCLIAAVAGVLLFGVGIALTFYWVSSKANEAVEAFEEQGGGANLAHH